MARLSGDEETLQIKNVWLPVDVHKQLKADAKRQRRTLPAQLATVLEQHYLKLNHDESHA